MQAPTDGLGGLVAHSVRELESLSREQDQNKRTDPGFESERDTKVPRIAKEPTQAGLRHVQTEQRRRDRINEGFATLKALMPGHEKADKATFLSNIVAYIKQLQGVMQQLVSTGAVSKLPEEAQWNIRVLLPRKSDAPVTMPAAHAAVPTNTPPGADPAAATAAMLSLLLNQPNGMAAQQGQPGLDIAQLLQQAAFSQQVQAQQGQLLQALQMQQLFQAAQNSTGMLVQNTQAPGAAGFSNMAQFLPSEPVPHAHLMPPMTVGCTQSAAASALPKARKNGKVRRHTSAARIAKPAAELDAPAVDVGRPAPTEVGV